MAAIAAMQAPLWEEIAEPFHYHDPGRPGFVALLAPSGGRKRQEIVRVAELAEAVERYSGQTDVWISQGEFRKPNRRVVNLWRMALAFADLDVYKSPRFGALATEAQVDALLRYCDDNGVSQPSLVVFSGRGLQAKWLFTQPIPRRALPRWTLVQRTLNERLLEFGADANALDASRVLRLVDTVNSRSNETVRVVYAATTPTDGAELLATGVIGYDFDVFADTLLPLTREALTELRKARAAERDAREAARASRLVCIEGGLSRRTARPASRRALIPSQLAWDRLEDLRTLAKLRGFERGLPSGQRDLFVFLAACFLADARVAPDLWGEVAAVAKEFAPGWSEGEVRSCVASVFARAEEAARGETVEFNGRDFNPRYRWKNETLLEWLSIEPHEEAQLKTIIGRNERQRRNTAQHLWTRRYSGAVPREVYLAEATKRREQARGYRAAGWSQRAIAVKLGVSVGAVANYCR